MMICYCPGCARLLTSMDEPNQFACLTCHKVWRIHDVIADACAATRELKPGDVLRLKTILSDQDQDP